MARYWIRSAINPAHKGQFAAKAKRAGMSTREFAQEHKGDKGMMGRQARLAMTLMGMHGKKRSVGQRMSERKAA